MKRETTGRAVSCSMLYLRKVCWRPRLAGALLFYLSMGAGAEVYQLPAVNVRADSIHSSQETRAQVEEAFVGTRSSTSTTSSELQNLNAVNTGDALRFTTPGIINTPGSDRFGGSYKLRTHGDWGAATSIDGMPAVEFAGEEGGGYSNARIPTISIGEITAHKGGRGVQYGSGSDGGVFQTNIKSGRGYSNHIAGTVDLSSAGETLTQLELANGTETSDYYFAGSYLYGDYNGTDAPSNLDMQKIGGLVGKVGFNPSQATRIEFLTIMSQSDTDIFRAGDLNDISSDLTYIALNVDHSLSQASSLRVGYQHSDTHTVWDARNRDRSTIIDTLFADYYFSSNLSDTINYAGSAGLEYKITNGLRDKQWDNTFKDPAVKVTNALTFNNNATLTLGLRNTWFDNDIEFNGVTQTDNLVNDSVLSWELGGAYSVVDSTRVRASVSSGYNRFFEKYGNFGTDALNPAGAQDEIVESLGYEVGANYGWGNGYLDVAYYTITQDNVPRRNAGAIQNVEVEQSGVEMELFAVLSDSLTLSGGYVHQFDVKATRADGTDAEGNIFFGTNGVNVAHNQFTLRLNYQLNDMFSVWGAGIHGEPFERDNADGATEVRRHSYNRFDLGTAVQLSEKAAFRVRIENLTDEKDFSQTLEGSTVNTDGKLGRVVWAGFDYTL